MEQNTQTGIETFGEPLATVWKNLRPTTRRLVERALAASSVATANRAPAASVDGRSALTPYDAPAEIELRRLLAALDARLVEESAQQISSTRNLDALTPEQTTRLRRMDETCALVLQRQAQSAESFAQLLLRAFAARDYKRIDLLADSLTKQLAPSEICELARHAHPAVRSIANETLAQLPTSLLVELLSDPVDFDTVRLALELQADDYGIEEARRVADALDADDLIGLDDDD